MKVILERLNRRLHDGRLSDATIAAVSCLALCENHAGNHKKWEMHAVGMSEMIRVRGGFSAIAAPMHMKIYRADILGGSDTLSIPHLPRPTRTTKSLYHTMGLSSSATPVIPILIELGLAPNVLDALIDLAYLCQALNDAADKQTVINPIAFDEDTVCIQHDLLTSNCPNQSSVEKTCRLAALILLQTLTRETPFTRLCSGLISRELKNAFLGIGTGLAPARLIFWVLFMGGLASMETEEKDWYQSKLRDFQSMRNDLVSWESAKTHLNKIFWVETVLEGYGKNLWHKINTPIDLSSSLITA